MSTRPFNIFEFGVSSGNDATFITSLLKSKTNNFYYTGVEHPISCDTSKVVVPEKLTRAGISPQQFEIRPQLFEEFTPLEKKADLIIASRCLSFCQSDKFENFIHNIAKSVADGGVFLGDIYLSAMGSNFKDYTVERITSLLNGTTKVSQAEDAFSIFEGFSIQVQLSAKDLVMHFVAQKTNCKGVEFTQSTTLIDSSNQEVSQSQAQYSSIAKSDKAKSERGDWNKYIESYKDVCLARPLVTSYFASEEGQTFLDVQLASLEESTNLNITPTEDTLNLSETNTEEGASTEGLSENALRDLELFKKCEEYKTPDALEQDVAPVLTITDTTIE